MSRQAPTQQLLIEYRSIQVLSVTATSLSWRCLVMCATELLSRADLISATSLRGAPLPESHRNQLVLVQRAGHWYDTSHTDPTP